MPHPYGIYLDLDRRITELAEKYSLSKDKKAELSDIIKPSFLLAELCHSVDRESKPKRSAAKNLVKQGEQFLNALKGWQAYVPDPFFRVEINDEHGNSSLKTVKVKSPFPPYIVDNIEAYIRGLISDAAVVLERIPAAGRGNTIEYKRRILIGSFASAYQACFGKEPAVSKNANSSSKKGTFHRFCEDALTAVGMEGKLSQSTLAKYIEDWKNDSIAKSLPGFQPGVADIVGAKIKAKSSGTAAKRRGSK